MSIQQMTDVCALSTVHRVTQYIIRSHLALGLLTKYQNSKYKNDLSEKYFYNSIMDIIPSS